MSTKKCPYCAEEIQEEAILCRHCGSRLNIETIRSDTTINNYSPSATQQKAPGFKKVIIPIGIALAVVLVIIVSVVIWHNTSGVKNSDNPFGTPVYGHLGATFEEAIKEYGSEYKTISDSGTINNGIMYGNNGNTIAFLNTDEMMPGNISMIIVNPGNPISNRLDDKLDMTMSFSDIQKLYEDAELLYDNSTGHYSTSLPLSSTGGVFSNYSIDFTYISNSGTDMPIQAYLYSQPYAIAMNAHDNIDNWVTSATTTAPVTTTVETSTTTTTISSSGVNTDIPSNVSDKNAYKQVCAVAEKIQQSIKYYHDDTSSVIKFNGKTYTNLYVDEFDLSYYGLDECYIAVRKDNGDTYGIYVVVSENGAFVAYEYDEMAEQKADSSVALDPTTYDNYQLYLSVQAIANMNDDAIKLVTEDGFYIAGNEEYFDYEWSNVVYESECYEESMAWIIPLHTATGSNLGVYKDCYEMGDIYYYPN